MNKGLLFKATFNAGLDADYSRGSPFPVATKIDLVTDNGKGRSGEAVFVGSEDYLVYEGKDNCNPRQGMLVMWVKPEMDTPTDSMAGRYFFHLCGNGGDMILYVAGEGQLVLRTFSHGGRMVNLESPSKLPVGEWKGQWHEVGFSYDLDEGTAKIVFDGKAVAAGRIALPDLSDQDFNIGIGCNASNHRGNFRGYLDDFRIYSSYIDYMVDRALGGGL